MKFLRYIMVPLTIIASQVFVQCVDDDDNVIMVEAACDDGIQNGDETGVDCGGTCSPCATAFNGTYIQEDQMGRPGINTVFGTDGMKDEFNVTVPSNMNSQFQTSFQTKLEMLNPAYTTNALGLDAEQFTGVLATDVLWVAETGQTTYFDPNGAILTGRTLQDDVIDISLLLIYGGPDGSENPMLTTDYVDNNDAGFSSSFPYVVEANQ